MFSLFHSFSKKWLPQQLRKLSHSKTDKLTVEKSALKKGSDKKSKVTSRDLVLWANAEFFQFQDKQKEEPESPAPTSLSLPGPSTLTNSIHHHPEEVEDALECLELPPPMKPIQDASQIVGDDNCNQTTNPSNSTLDESDLAEIEQIVKEKMVSLQARVCLLRFLINTYAFQEKHEASLKHPQSLSPQVSENEDVSLKINFSAAPPQ